MKKHLTILVFILLSQFKDNKKFIISKSKIINIKNYEFNKNLKSYKRRYCTRYFKIIGYFNDSKDPIQKLNYRVLFKIKIFARIIILITNKKLLRNFKRIDFNVFDQVLYGCSRLSNR
jgi:hypothetical protein